MGLGKWQHIEALGKLPAVDARWQAKFGRAMNAADIDAIYAAFMPLQIAKVVDFSAPIAGVVDTIAALRAEGIKIGSCSGYPRPVMEKLAPAAAAQGYAPDHWVGDGRSRRRGTARPVDGVTERHCPRHRLGSPLRQG